MVILIDNYDSFSYNLYQLIGTCMKELGMEDVKSQIRVFRNDRISIEEIEALAPSHIFLSPGPGRPADAGICELLVSRLGEKLPILGVCLGHQAICESYHVKVGYAKEMMHGKVSQISSCEESRVFCGMPERFQVARYHSLAADPEADFGQLRVVAKTDDGEVMAVEHREYPVFGLQFHPESVMTPEGDILIRNFLQIGR